MAEDKNESGGIGLGQTRGPIGIEELGDTGMKMANNALANLTKKTAASFWGNFKRLLSTASEPLLRKEMGERYMSSEAASGGIMIWVCSTLLAIFWPDVRSAGALIDATTSFHRLGHLMNNVWPTILVGGALVYFNFRFCMENNKLMAVYRDKGEAYHTQSRGVPRWDNFPMMPLLIIAALFLFDLPAGILFVISMGMSAKIAGEQQAAIYARYLDALDTKIEQEYLENAILGKCPTEITQLHKPLPGSLNADLRKNIAAAAVGKPVSIMVKGSRTNGQTRTTKPAVPDINIPQSSPASSTGGREGESSPVPAAGSTSGEEKAEPDPAVQVQLFSIPKVDPRTIKRAAILAAGIFAIYIVCHLCSFMWREIHGYLARRHAANPTVAVSSVQKESPTVVQSQPRRQLPVATPAGNSNPENTPVESTVTQNTPRAIVATKPPIEPTTSPNTPPAAVEPNTPVGSTSSQNTPQDVIQAKQPTATQNTPPALPESSQGKLAEAIKSLNVFSNYCYATLSTDNALIGKISDQGYHERLERISQAVEQSISKIIARQQEYLDQLTPGPDADASIERSTPKLVANRSSETNNLVQLNLAIQQAMPKN